MSKSQLQKPQIQNTCQHVHTYFHVMETPRKIETQPKLIWITKNLMILLNEVNERDIVSQYWMTLLTCGTFNTQYLIHDHINACCGSKFAPINNILSIYGVSSIFYQ